MTEKSSQLHAFLEKIMAIQALNMGGAAAGIFGQSDAQQDVLRGLKHTTATFAAEYVKPAPSASLLDKLSKEIDGSLQTLYVTNVLSKDSADTLIDELHLLIDTPPARS